MYFSFCLLSVSLIVTFHEFHFRLIWSKEHCSEIKIVMEKRIFGLILILCLTFNQIHGGALVPRYSGKPQNSLFEQFWTKVNNFISGGLHLIGSILPLRGLATIAKDLGFPIADSILSALTPTKRGPNPFLIGYLFNNLTWTIKKVSFVRFFVLNDFSN